MIKQRIHQAMIDGVELRRRCADELSEPLLAASTLMVECLQRGGKVLACGNGGSAADAQHFAAELVNRFQINRPGLAGIALTHDASVITSIANDFDFADVFARQVEALGRAGDVLLAISTSGNSANVLAAMTAAQQANMPCIAMCGGSGGSMLTHPASSVAICIPHQATPRIQEMHITCLHIICDLVDHAMFCGETP